MGEFVDKQKLRRAHERGADREHLALAAGELRAAVLPALTQAREQIEDFVDRPAVSRPRRFQHGQMLGHGQGYASLMSGYGVDRSGQLSRDAGPPSDGNGNTIGSFNQDGSSKCTVTFGSVQAAQWICEHRRPAIANMVAFRHAAAGTPTTTCGRSSFTINTDPNRVAFCRDGAGFVAISNSATDGTDVLPTRLPAGTYCNVAQFNFTPAAGSTPAACSGAPIVVSADGSASITLTRRSAVALHTRAKLN